LSGTDVGAGTHVGVQDLGSSSVGGGSGLHLFSFLLHHSAHHAHSAAAGAASDSDTNPGDDKDDLEEESSENSRGKEIFTNFASSGTFNT